MSVSAGRGMTVFYFIEIRHALLQQHLTVVVVYQKKHESRDPENHKCHGIRLLLQGDFALIPANALVSVSL
jgi:hypothetical protein